MWEHLRQTFAYGWRLRIMQQLHKIPLIGIFFSRIINEKITDIYETTIAFITTLQKIESELKSVELDGFKDNQD